MNKKRITLMVISGAAAIGIVAGLIVGNSLYKQFEGTIVGVLCPPIKDEKAAEASSSAGNELAEKLVAEGSVLLKNNGTLPLSGDSVTGVNLLGFGSYNWQYTGSGSGISAPQKGGWESNTDLRDAFIDYGIQINEDLYRYYSSYSNTRPDLGTLGNNRDSNPYYTYLVEPDLDADASYKTLLTQAPSFSNTAIVSIGRSAGESEDLPMSQYKTKPSAIDETRHTLQLTTEEEKLLRFAGSAFENVIVLINSTNTFQTDFLDTIPGIDAALNVGVTGNHGALAIPKLLFGEVNPSGHLADTVPYDFLKNVNAKYTGFEGVSFYKNSADVTVPEEQKRYGHTNAGYTNRPGLAYVDYIENIYVGYRWYETASVEGVFDKETREALDINDNPITKTKYDAVVQYPFGYGLSYTNFDWRINSAKVFEKETNEDGTVSEKEVSGDSIEVNRVYRFEVEVTNVGSVAGKDVVELYSAPSYTEDGIEKSVVNLLDFAKTDIIQPGESEVVTVEAETRDFASFDAYDKNNNVKSTYEIDEGSYTLQLMSDSHHVKEITSEGGEKVPAVKEYQAKSTLVLDKDPYTEQEISNIFTGTNSKDGVSVDGLGETGGNQKIDYISRGDFNADYAYPREKTSTGDITTGRDMASNIADKMYFQGYDRKDRSKAIAFDNATVDAFGNEVDQTPVTYKAGDLKVTTSTKESKLENVTELGFALGENYDDPRWEDVLKQVSNEEARATLSNAFSKQSAIASIGLPEVNTLDGPSQIGGFTSPNKGVGFPNSTLVAQTWDKILAYEEGLSIGNDMEALGLYGICGTGADIHRSPFGGRNFEYYSEDPLLSGTMAGNYVKGIRQSGKIAYLKHFALAETETCRDNLYTWVSEQALREIYLEPFRIAIQEYGANGLMTSYNRVGALWAGGSVSLMTGVLRNEWGFKGAVITDYSDLNRYMDLDETLRAGGDLGMAVGTVSDYSTPRAQRVLRNAVKHVTYAYLNAMYSRREYNKNPWKGKTVTSSNSRPSFNWVTPLVIDVNVALGFVAFGLVFFGVFDSFGLCAWIDQKVASKKKKNEEEK